MDTNKKEEAAVAFTITGNWAAQAKQLKGMFTELTDEDLKFETGKEEELLTRVKSKLNKTREEVIILLTARLADKP